jgi:hypothetical protein
MDVSVTPPWIKCGTTPLMWPALFFKMGFITYVKYYTRPLHSDDAHS